MKLQEKRHYYDQHDNIWRIVEFDNFQNRKYFILALAVNKSTIWLDENGVSESGSVKLIKPVFESEQLWVDKDDYGCRLDSFKEKEHIWTTQESDMVFSEIELVFKRKMSLKNFTPITTDMKLQDLQNHIDTIYKKINNITSYIDQHCVTENRQK